MKKILFVFPYPSGTAASQRFRFEQYLHFLSEAGFTYKLSPFLNEKTWKILYKEGFLWQKISGILLGFLKRIFLMFSVWRYDFVFVHREASPIGFPVFEWLIAKVFRKKMIFDFDDALWLPAISAQNTLANLLKFHSKTKYLIRWSYKISAGNTYLAEQSRFFSRLENVISSKINLIPTTIDTENLHNRIKNQDTEKFVIGWTGTHSTLPYLNEILPVIRKLEDSYDFTFMIICNKNPEFNLKSFHFLPWQKATEIEDLLLMNSGVMPLTDDAWAKGKCGFKALQYMALGIPALVSPVGVNSEIIQNQENGFLCQSPEDWEKAMILLLENPEKRKIMGANARKTIVEKYAVQANRAAFLGLFT
ncbi:MAG: glycosyltransferase [Verrucomicrobia bacterium]|nr:glycosyltransferase [Cytophagales bacterium]